MKNMKKLAAGFIAAAMAMSMSLSAFADAVVPTISTDKLTLNIGTGITTVNGAQTTMMAYVVPGIITEVAAAPAYDATAHEMVALDQVDGTTGIASVPVDNTKLADGNTIVVKISGTDGNLATYLITMLAPVVTYSVTYELAGGTVTNAGANTFDADDTIAEFFANLEDPVKAAIETETYEFDGWSKTADGEVIDEESTALMTTLLDEGATSITLYAKYTGTPVSEPVVIVVGDVDGDGIITGTDRDMLKAYCGAADKAAFNTANSMQIGVDVATGLVIGDVDGDNIITGTDRDMLKAYCGAADKAAFNTANSMVIGQEKSSK